MIRKVLALDIGDKRIGVALADLSAPFPQPLTTLEADSTIAEQLKSLIEKHHIVAVVVGLPRNQAGERTAQTERVEHVVKLLNLPESVSVHWQDESLTSKKAESELKKRKKNFVKADIDALAATYILEDFLAVSPSVEPPKEAVTPAESSQTKKKTHRGLKKTGVSLLSLLIGIVVALVLGVVWYQYQLQPRTSADVYHTVTIAPGTTTSQIAQTLEQKQIIRSATAFRLYVGRHHDTSLQAGSYRLSSKQPVSAIVSTITGGKVTSLDILIAPGLREDQVTKKLENAGFSKSDIDEAYQTSLSHSLLVQTGSTSLEGYLFPDTYKVGPDSTATQLVTLMLNNFSDKISSDITVGLSKQGLTLRQGIILASIVQKEVSAVTTQPTVAQVFEKRLKDGTVLGSDVTYMYAAAVTGQTASPDLDSPYNTRKFPGLPPGPISNFNLSALEAVANPSTTDYNYFVAGDDGQVHFSHTIEEHQALTKQYCKKLCSE